MEDNKIRLILGVKKPIWLAVGKEPEFRVIGWTTRKPIHDNGFIDEGALLIFSHIYKPPENIYPERVDALNFMMVIPGSKSEPRFPEFDEKEIESLLEEGALEPYLVWIDIDEISITKGNVFIKYPRKISFDERFFVPKEIYLIIGPEESSISGHKLGIGEKISLKQLLEHYSD